MQRVIYGFPRHEITISHDIGKKSHSFALCLTQRISGVLFLCNTKSDCHHKLPPTETQMEGHCAFFAFYVSQSSRHASWKKRMVHNSESVQWFPVLIIIKFSVLQGIIRQQHSTQCAHHKDPIASIWRKEWCNPLSSPNFASPLPMTTRLHSFVAGQYESVRRIISCNCK